MAILEIWYSVHDGGDGSAYPRWFETRRLTEMDQELIENGWGECCNGSLKIEGENMRVLSHVTTTEEFIERLDRIINSQSRYTTRSEKEKASSFKEELSPGSMRKYTENDPYGEEIYEKVKKFNDFTKKNPQVIVGFLI